jgi:hypothetical protein
MATRTPTRGSHRRRPRRRTATAARTRTTAAIRAAAARAVERVLASEEAFALLIRRLEAAGWQVERMAGDAPRLEAAEHASPARGALTPPARAR